MTRFADEHDGDCFDEEMWADHNKAWNAGYDSHPKGSPPYDHPSLNSAWERGWWAKKDGEPDPRIKGKQPDGQ